MPGSPISSVGVKLIVRVLQDLVVRDRFDSYADLKDALKTRLAKLRIPYEATVITEALDQVEQGGRRPLVPVAPREVPVVQVKPVSQADAVRILTRYGVVVKTIAPAPWTDVEHAAREDEDARQRALEMGIVL
jgi:hypothetical protein